MSDKIKKQFGVWMDSHQAIVVGNNGETSEFATIGHVSNDNSGSNSSEKTANNAERSSQQKFFKEIGTHMVNAEEVHITGTGTSQEQFIRYLSETPQFKNTVANESTSNKMSDEKLAEFIAAKFN
jgi:stalled ribosome rescue protein Dom34